MKRIGGAPKDASLTAFEQNVATRCELLFGENAAPHVLDAFTLEDIDGWLVQNIAMAKEAHIGAVLLWKEPYTTGDAAVGVPPDNGRLVWKEPERLRKCVDICREFGLALFMYVHPKVLRNAGMESHEIVAELRRHMREYGITKFYFDGVEAGDNLAETEWVYKTLLGYGAMLWAHDTVQPHIAPRELVYWHGDTQAGKVQYLMPQAWLFDRRITGENIPVPTERDEFIEFLHNYAAVTTTPDTILYYILGTGGPAEYGHNLFQYRTDSLFAFTTRPANWPSFARGLEIWDEARAEYQENPRALVEKRAREW